MLYNKKDTHILQKSSTAVRHPQLVINDYCQKDLYIVHLQREIK